MSATLQAIEAEALKLPIDERAELIERLLESVEPAAPLHPAWEAEIAQRCADLEAGRTVAIPGEQVFAELKAPLAIRAYAPGR